MKIPVKARILPLDGKYYGSTIEITFEDGNHAVIDLWYQGDWEPSDRELGNITFEQWKSNELLPDKVDGWTGKPGVRAKEWIDICDSHFESRTTYNLCKFIVEAINGQTNTKDSPGSKGLVC